MALHGSINSWIADLGMPFRWVWQRFRFILEQQSISQAAKYLCLPLEEARQAMAEKQRELTPLQFWHLAGLTWPQGSKRRSFMQQMLATRVTATLLEMETPLFPAEDSFSFGIMPGRLLAKLGDSPITWEASLEDFTNVMGEAWAEEQCELQDAQNQSAGSSDMVFPAPASGGDPSGLPKPSAGASGTSKGAKSSAATAQPAPAKKSKRPPKWNAAVPALPLQTTLPAPLGINSMVQGFLDEVRDDIVERNCLAEYADWIVEGLFLGEEKSYENICVLKRTIKEDVDRLGRSGAALEWTSQQWVKLEGFQHQVRYILEVCGKGLLVRDKHRLIALFSFGTPLKWLASMVQQRGVLDLHLNLTKKLAATSFALQRRELEVGT